MTELTEEWKPMGKPLMQTEEGRKSYSSARRGTYTFSVGDAVQVRSPNEEPWIAKLSGIFEDAAGALFAKLQWYLARTDLKGETNGDRKELLEGTSEDTNQIETILKKVHVFSKEAYYAMEDEEIKADNYYCSFRCIDLDAKKLERIEKLEPIDDDPPTKRSKTIISGKNATATAPTIDQGGKGRRASAAGGRVSLRGDDVESPEKGQRALLAVLDKEVDQWLEEANNLNLKNALKLKKELKKTLGRK
mmetsp:Transcript_5817/g.15207  ORF Transcript_5817/g.15207 Transcript_5817/m.15207 type:complete len:248 (-) Transcript_5817:245-988(-)